MGVVETLPIGDPRRGRHVLVTFAGWRNDAKPSRIEDHDGQVWVVEDVTRQWTHPRAGKSGPEKLPYGTEAERWTLDVIGPLPRSHGHGRQSVHIRSFGDGAGWYLLPGGA